MNPHTSAVLSTRFDWMSATIRDDVIDISDTIALALGGDISDGRGLNGYRASKVVKRDDETLARVLYGGNGNPHVIASGAPTDEVVPVIRAVWGDAHEVTRMDTAQDFDQEGGYERLRSVLSRLADAHRITLMTMESTRRGITSRTTYLGSPTSRVRVRLYEKGCFEQQERREASGDWVRLEAQIRPTGRDARTRAAHLDSLEAWGISRWTRELAREAMGADVEPVVMRLHREPDYMRAMRSLQRQYGPTLERALEVEGSWDNVGRLLGILP
jgi:hypothetical protein